MKLLPVSAGAVLIELAGLDETLALYESLRADPVAGITELVPAARTVLVSFDRSVVTARDIAAAVRARDVDPVAASGDTIVEIPVRYDGDDLAEVAGLLGIAVAEVVRRHTGTAYRVAFTGFAPGFAYLAGDSGLRVPRRPSPRTRIPAGAVGLAGEFSGIYPRESPGGWQLIGTTDTELWNLRRDPPALLQPGFGVRFVDVTGGVGAAAPRARAGADAGTDAAPGSRPGWSPVHPGKTERVDAAIEVIAVGPQVLLQDLGRPGLATLGVSPSGALDRASLRTANRRAGNPPGSAALEVAAGGLRIASRGTTLVGVAGAAASITVVTAAGERELAGAQTVLLADGDELAIGSPSAGLRSYLAVRGGFAIDPVLGSLSTDTLSGIGPAPVTAGVVLPVRWMPRRAPAVDLDSLSPAMPGHGVTTLDLALGPRTDWFDDAAVALLADQVWTVTPRSNRVGLRLKGVVPLARRVGAGLPSELPSEGTVTGAVQVPADGQPVLFLADRPLTGGYPVIGAVAGHHLNLAGQLAPGAGIRFRPLAPFSHLGDADVGP
ncbi:5-oxoprolinase subunit B/C family protein [Marisediminicola senii]|uniref:5-oxoprolinase subunit B/C family protein n=1 Tax=Marisediminicola senii TaxID=2711233 RepID=UPI0013EC99A0|nr:urea amidolyase family protein [Marisediminicola senii]